MKYLLAARFSLGHSVDIFKDIQLIVYIVNI